MTLKLSLICRIMGERTLMNSLDCLPSLLSLQHFSPQSLLELTLLQLDSVPCCRQLDQRSYQILDEPIRFPSSGNWNWDEKEQVWVGIFNRGDLNRRTLFSLCRGEIEGAGAQTGRRWQGVEKCHCVPDGLRFLVPVLPEDWVLWDTPVSIMISQWVSVTGDQPEEAQLGKGEWGINFSLNWWKDSGPCSARSQQHCDTGCRVSRLPFSSSIISFCYFQVPEHSGVLISVLGSCMHTREIWGTLFDLAVA